MRRKVKVFIELFHDESLAAAGVAPQINALVVIQHGVVIIQLCDTATTILLLGCGHLLEIVFKAAELIALRLHLCRVAIQKP